MQYKEHMKSTRGSMSNCLNHSFQRQFPGYTEAAWRTYISYFQQSSTSVQGSQPPALSWRYDIYVALLHVSFLWNWSDSFDIKYVISSHKRPIQGPFDRPGCCTTVWDAYRGKQVWHYTQCSLGFIFLSILCAWTAGDGRIEALTFCSTSKKVHNQNLCSCECQKAICIQVNCFWFE